MATSPDLATFAHKMDRVIKDLADEQMFKAVGEAGKKLANRAVQNDLGDMSMSGWRRGKPFDVESRYDIEEAARTVEISPQRKAKGPMRVLEDGRQAYSAGARRKSGTRTRKKDGAVIEKYRTVSRNMGATKGKQTWTDATELMERELPKVAAKHVETVLRKHF